MLATTAVTFVLSICSCTSTSKNSGTPAANNADATQILAADSALFEKCTDVPQTAAVQFVTAMGDGINIGNTLDCITDRDGIVTPQNGETAWGNPRITQAYVDALRDYGYKTIRLPVTWAEHMDTTDGTYKISDSWMKRVAECVQYCLNDNLYVIINLHHDGGGSKTSWILNAGKKNDDDEYTENYKKTYDRFTKVWTQIATYFKDYPDHLIFEAMNEVGYDKIALEDAYNIVNSFNQQFVNIVRSTGGNNTTRYLMSSGYWTDIKMTCDDEYYKIPEDPSNEDPHIILTVHYYTPSSFAISMDPTNKWWYRKDWGTENDVDELKGLFALLHDTYLVKGIPVVIGEYGCVKKNHNYRIAWFSCVRKICESYDMCPVLWDTGGDISRTSPFKMSDDLKKANAR